MLTLEEARLSLGVFQIFSLLNIFPIQIDVKSGRIQRQLSKIRVFIWKLLFGGGISHWLYIFGRLVQSTILEPEKYFRWDHFVLHFGLTFAAAVFYFIGFVLFVRNANENTMIFNQLFLEREDPVQKMMDREKKLQRQTESGTGNEKEKRETLVVSASARRSNESSQMEVIENQSETQARPRPLLTWSLQYSLDELLAKLLPLVVLASAFFVMLILGIDPSRPQLLYSVLPPEWQNVWSFLILLAVETLCLVIFLSTGCFAIVIQVLFFGKCQLEFSRLSLQLRNLKEKFQNHCIGNGGREVWIRRQILKEMRELVALIELFNRCYPFCIFVWKIFSLSVCIMFYFFAIRHYEDFPLLAAFIGYAAVAITVIYTIMYGHAFSIPGKMDDLKNEFLLTAQTTTSNSSANGNGNKKVWAEMKREMKRIHGVGIKVGSFNQMERESTPRFVDFVFRNVVNLLVTFSR